MQVKIMCTVTGKDECVIKNKQNQKGKKEKLTSRTVYFIEEVRVFLLCHSRKCNHVKILIQCVCGKKQTLSISKQIL